MGQKFSKTIATQDTNKKITHNDVTDEVPNITFLDYSPTAPMLSDENDQDIDEVFDYTILERSKPLSQDHEVFNPSKHFFILGSKIEEISIQVEDSFSDLHSLQIAFNEESDSNKAALIKYFAEKQSDIDEFATKQLKIILNI